MNLSTTTTMPAWLLNLSRCVSSEAYLDQEELAHCERMMRETLTDITMSYNRKLALVDEGMNEDQRLQLQELLSKHADLVRCYSVLLLLNNRQGQHLPRSHSMRVFNPERAN